MAYDQKSLDDYVDVDTRVHEFREKYPDGSLQAYEPWKFVMVQGFEKNGDVAQQTFICYTAAAYRTPDDPRPGIGVAWEIFPGRTPYTRGSELQNAETSAWGRAIIAVGASDSKRGIASREEVRNRQAERGGWSAGDVNPLWGDRPLTEREAQALNNRAAGLRDDGLPTNADGSLSRSRTTDEQKQAAGVMTDAQQRAHNQLAKPPPNTQPVDRQAATPDRPVNGCTHTPPCLNAALCLSARNDPWYDSPAPLADLTNPEDAHGTATADQIRSLQARFAEQGVKERDGKIAWLRGRFGPDIHSSKDLSYTQAARALQVLAEDHQRES